MLVLFLFALPLRADWRGDIKVLTTELQKIHPRFRECGLPAAIISEANALSSRADTMSDPQVVVGLQHLLAAVGDGHTLVWPFGMKKGILLRVPIMLWSFDDGVYVADATDAALTGRRVTHVGDLTVDEALKRIAPYVSHDNDMQLRWAAPFYLTLTDFAIAVGAGSDRNTLTLTFADGAKKTLTAAPIDPENLEIKLLPRGAKRQQPFRAEEIRPRTLYVAVDSMTDGLDQFALDLRRRLQNADRLILDLRLNNGGEASKADELLKTLIAFDTRGGTIVTLIGRMTFSAAQTFAARIDQWTNTKFIGEPTGSRPNHYGNERPFKLPDSGVRGTISSGWNQPVTARDARDTIKPDIAVPNLAADYFAGRDPALECAAWGSDL